VIFENKGKKIPLVSFVVCLCENHSNISVITACHYALL
jgi:hypothetical protein